MKRTLIIVLATATLGACDTAGGGAEPGPGPAYMPPSRSGPESFQESDFAWSQGQGGGSIDGVLAYRPGGARYACQDVVLAPETPWSRARMRILYLSTTQAAMPVDDVKSRTPPEHGAEYARYARHSTCDGGGHFAFSGIPNGSWYVITVAAPVSGGMRMAVMRRVEIDGDNVKVVLH
jgi:hypothetical protein